MENGYPKGNGGKKMSDDNSVFVGDKPFMNYVSAVIVQFNMNQATTVVIKARGKYTSKAIDIALMTKERHLKNQVAINNIDIKSEKFTSKEGKEITVSAIEITIAKL